MHYGPRLAAALLAGFAFIRAFRPLADLDPFWHLSMGRAAWDARARSFPDPVGPDPTALYTAAEWLFDIGLFWVHAWAGLAGITALAALCAGVGAVAVWALAGRFSEDHQWGAVAVAALAVGASTLQFVPRPQALFLVALPLLMLCAHKAAKAPGPRWVAASLAVVAVWAQSHTSMILAPVVVSGVMFEALAHRQQGVAWLWGLVAGSVLLVFTGPFGVGVLDQVLSHAGTDVAQQIIDMGPPQAIEFWPLHQSHNHNALFAELLCGLGIAGIAVRRPGWRRWMGPLALAVLGLALAITARRFFAAWGVLSVPLAAMGWAGLFPRETREARLLAALCLIGSPALLTYGHLEVGVGLDSRTDPVDLPDVLDALNVQGQVFNDYDTGAHLGWQGYGRRRVWIDGRTPVFFDADHFFEARLALTESAGFYALTAQKGFSAAVVPVGAPLCGVLANDPDWSAQWRGDGYAVFVPGAGGLHAVDPCGDRSHWMQRCREAPDDVRPELARLAADFPHSPSAQLLAAQIELGCEGNVAAARTRVDNAAASKWPHHDQCWIEGLTLMAEKRVPEAVDHWFGCPPDPRIEAGLDALSGH